MKLLWLGQPADGFEQPPLDPSFPREDYDEPDDKRAQAAIASGYFAAAEPAKAKGKKSDA